MMSFPQQDKPFVRWAHQKGLSYYYTQERDLPTPCLKLHLEVLTAYVHQGRLVRVVVDSTGNLLDQMMYEFSELFALCAKHRAYLRQASCHTSPAIREHNT